MINPEATILARAFSLSSLNEERVGVRSLRELGKERFSIWK
jgi:hypothetical protein